MKLIIAEKPSLGRAIAAALPNPQKNEKTHIVCGEYVVTWCFGHLLELKMPGDYNPEYQSWDKRPIPFMPEHWQRKVSGDKGAQVKAIKELIAKSSVVINAGDPDREGSMLVDSLINFLGYKGDVWRLLVSDTNTKAVKRAISKMDKYNSTAAESASADARSKADWLYGINLTTAFTLAARSLGYDGVLNVGRVQTPVLGLVVQRKKDRDNFKPHDFYNLTATVVKGFDFKAKLDLKKVKGEFDSEGRLISINDAQQLKEATSNNPATVKSVISENTKSNAPALFSLSELQKLANKKLGLTATETLAAAQELYEGQATTYPRTDCSYISSELWEDAKNTLPALATVNKYASNANPEIKHPCVNNEKVGAHHAIIPTDNVPDLAKLSARNKAVYEIIVERYISIFYPVAEDAKTKVILDIGGYEFYSKGTVELKRGWREVIAAKKPDNQLPDLMESETLEVKAIDIEASKTTPPDEFTEATLLDAMTNIAKFVSDDELKKILKETDGLGTEATRAAIIEGLVTRSYLNREGKKILPTEKGIEFIEQLPAEITLPDMTAKWELALNDIKNTQDVNSFLSDVFDKVGQLAQNPNIKITNVVNNPCPNCQNNLRRFQRKDKSAYFWSCSNKECDFICDDNRGKPAESKIHNCPDCSKKLARRKGNNGWFWSCTGYPECSYSADDNKGAPVKKSDNTDTCPKCKAEVKRLKSKNGKDYFWVHSENTDSCEKYLSDEKGKPAIKEKTKVEAGGEEISCPDCNKPMILRNGKYGKFYGCSGYPGCKKIVKVG